MFACKRSDLLRGYQQMVVFYARSFNEVGKTGRRRALLQPPAPEKRKKKEKKEEERKSKNENTRLRRWGRENLTVLPSLHTISALSLFWFGFGLAENMADTKAQRQEAEVRPSEPHGIVQSRITNGYQWQILALVDRPSNLSQASGWSSIECFRKLSRHLSVLKAHITLDHSLLLAKRLCQQPVMRSNKPLFPPQKHS